MEINRKLIDTPLKEIINLLQEKGIQTRAIWGLICEQKPYRNEIAYQIEQAPIYAESIINIPSSTQISEDEIVLVTNEMKALLKELAND